MRYLYFLLLALFITGCANNSIRYVRAKKQRPVVLAEANASSDQESAKQETKKRIASFENSTETIETSVSDDFSYTSKPQSAASEISLKSENPTSVQDTITISAYEKSNVALRAENQALNAKRLFAGSLAVMFIPIIGPLFIISFIWGWVLLAKSNNARFITPFGERQAWIASILRWVIVGIIALGIILAALILLIFW